MKNLTLISITLGLLVGACGDNEKGPVDAAKAIDAPDELPAAPTLGAQIDRMGRPAINTALTAPINEDPLKTAKKDAYNHLATAATFVLGDVNPAGNDVLAPSTIPGTGANPRTVRGEFARNLALFDSLDQGTPLAAVGTVTPGTGCGNQALFSAAGGYSTLATVLGDDVLYVDTSKLTCNAYLSLEVEVATSGGVIHSQCGGRTLTHDVVDTSYSLLAAGLAGFSTALAPLVGDGVATHTDVNNDVFPFLGPPHS